MDRHKLIHYYVDESGDLTLFNKDGIPVQNESSPKTLMLGLLKMQQEENFNKDFTLFKQSILNDPIFQTFPSIEKTKQCFHAKDDHIAIKREVFKYIANLSFSVQVIVRRKAVLMEQAKMQFEYTNQKMGDKQIYNDMAKRLFGKNLHKAENYNIYFANRGKTFSNTSLTESLYTARQIFCDKYRINSNSNFKVFCVKSSDYPLLQVIDYCLWALQRMYEKQEDVYFNIIQEKFKLIIDVDDKRNNGYGAYYSPTNKISLLKLYGVS